MDSWELRSVGCAFGAAATLGLRSSPAGEAGRAGSEAAKRSRP